MSAAKGAKPGKPGKPGKKHKGGHEEEHANHERWLVSYADMLTLLFVLFVVLFSMSTVDNKKFSKLADGLAEGFGAPTVAFTGKTSAMNGAGGSQGSTLPLMPPANPGVKPAVQSPAKGSTGGTESLAQKAVATAERAKASRNARAAAREVKNLRKVQEKITEALRRARLEKSVRFTINERGLVVTVVSSEVVFEGDRADLLPAGRKILDAVGPPLVRLPNSIQVDGHTNQLRVPTVVYPSAWELSTARASITVRYLNARGVPARRLSAAGYAGTRPLIDPKDPRSVEMNRRVDIVVLTQLPADQAALLPSAAGAD
ncbi:MAG TPA: flagellar motor protein MotB [Pilimelia sp.]|nr:flagellar motor protein MotB [Pilimelia sp.]